jgi:NAD(P)H-dependent FMN reductase
MTVISVIVGSTREGRFSEKPAKWILQHLKMRERVDARLLDLRDFPMPFFDQVATPAMPGRPAFAHEVVQKWTAAIAKSDGFVFVTPEYNYGPSAVLKNAIDWVYLEWNRKAVGFVSYGSAMGARSVQQLRETAIELQLAPIRSSVHIPVAALWAHYQGGDVEAGLAELEAPAAALIDDLLWWTAALRRRAQARPDRNLRSIAAQFSQESRCTHLGEKILRDGNWAADWAPAETVTR